MVQILFCSDKQQRQEDKKTLSTSFCTFFSTQKQSVSISRTPLNTVQTWCSNSVEHEQTSFEKRRTHKRKISPIFGFFINMVFLDKHVFAHLCLFATFSVKWWFVTNYLYFGWPNLNNMFPQVKQEAFRF